MAAAGVLDTVRGSGWDGCCPSPVKARIARAETRLAIVAEHIATI